MIQSLSVVIPTRGYSKNLKDLLVTIARQKISFDVEVIVVVNATHSKAYEEVKENLRGLVLDTSLLYISEVGVNFARNAGILAAKNDLILFFDDDCEPVSDQLLAQHRQHHQSLPSLFALGGVYHLADHAGFFDRLYHLIQMRWLYEGLKSDHGSASYYLIGGHFSVKKDLLQDYKINFNEKIIYGGSELEFFLQANKKDLKLELSELSVLHKTNESFFSITQKIYKQGRGKYISEKNFPFQAYLHQNDSEVAWTDSKWTNFWLIYANYVFWYGYYSAQQKKSQFFIHFFKNMISSLKNRKFLILRKLEASAHEKMKHGDRL